MALASGQKHLLSSQMVLWIKAPCPESAYKMLLCDQDDTSKWGYLGQYGGRVFRQGRCQVRVGHPPRLWLGGAPAQKSNSGESSRRGHVSDQPQRSPNTAAEQNP